MIGVSLTNVNAAGEYGRPGPGAYVIRITKALNNPGKKRIEFEFDIADGQFKNYFSETSEKFGWWGGKFNKPYSDKALPFFKGFVEAVQASNDDTTGLVIGDFEDVDESKFVGKLVGATMGEKEYMGNDGNIKTKLDTYNARFYSIQEINDGNYIVPDFVPYREDDRPATGKVVDTTTDDIPEGFQDSIDETPF